MSTDVKTSMCMMKQVNVRFSIAINVRISIAFNIGVRVRVKIGLAIAITLTCKTLWPKIIKCWNCL